MNLWEDVGFFGMGLLIGALLIEARYRYRAAVAARLMGDKAEAQKNWWDVWMSIGSTEREMISIGVAVGFIACLIIPIAVGGCVVHHKYTDETEIQASREGIVYTKSPTGTGRWIKVSDMKTVLEAEKGTGK